MEQEQKALQERIGNGEDVVVDNPTEGEQRVIEMNVGIVAGNDDSDWTEDSGELSRFHVFHFGLQYESLLFALFIEPDSPESPPRPGDNNDFTSDSDSDSTNSSSSDSGSSDGGDDKKKASTSSKSNSSRKRSLVQEVGDGSPTDKASKVAE